MSLSASTVPLTDICNVVNYVITLEFLYVIVLYVTFKINFSLSLGSFEQF